MVRKLPLTVSGIKQKQKKLLNNIKNNNNRTIIFSDEKSFTVNYFINKQNDRVVSFDQDISEVGNVSTTKYPASVMMLGVDFSSNQKKMTSEYQFTARD